MSEKIMSEGFEKCDGFDRRDLDAAKARPPGLIGGLGLPSVPRKPVDPKFRIDRLRIRVKEAQLEVEQRQIDLQEAMYEAGQIGPSRTEEKDVPQKTLHEMISEAPEPLRTLLFEAWNKLYADPPPDGSEPAPQPPGGAGSGRDEPEIPMGFTAWADVTEPMINPGPGDMECLLADGSRTIINPGAAAMNWPSNRLIAYRIIESEPAPPQQKSGLPEEPSSAEAST